MKKVKVPSIRKDIVKSIFVSFLIVVFLLVVYLLFGDAKVLYSKLTAFGGAVLAFSGLMAKQYLLKENIEYLNKWKKVERLIDEITINNTEKDNKYNKVLLSFSVLNNQAGDYIGYVLSEIKCIPVMPLILIILYGASLIAGGEVLVSLLCLVLMLIIVAYLSIATITSHNLSIDTSHLDETIQELEDLVAILREQKLAN